MTTVSDAYPLHETAEVIDSTKMTTYSDCPRQFFYNYILGWKHDRGPNHHLEWGSAIHLAMEHLLQHGHGIESIKAAQDKFAKYWCERYTPEIDMDLRPKNLEGGLRLIHDYIAHYPTQPYKVLFTEATGFAPLTNTLGVYVKMDALLEHEYGLAYMDHKTCGSMNVRWADQWQLSIQMGNYYHALHCVTDKKNIFGGIINGLCIQKTKTEFQRVIVTKKPIMELAFFNEMVALATEMEEQRQKLLEMDIDAPIMNAYPRRPTACSKFFGCPYQSHCSAVGNPIQGHCTEGETIGNTPPIGMKQEFWDPRAREDTKEERTQINEHFIAKEITK